MSKRVNPHVKAYIRELLSLGYGAEEAFRFAPEGSISIATVRRIAREIPPSGRPRRQLGRPPSFEEFLEKRGLPSEESIQTAQEYERSIQKARARDRALQEALDRPLFQIAFFDLETTHLRGDFGFILCAGFKTLGSPPEVIRIDDSPNYRKALWDDRWVIEQILKRLENVDIIVTYYGEKFDLPFLRTRLIRWGMPPLPRIFHIDLYTIPKRELLLHNNRLNTISIFLRGESDKTSLNPEIWIRASHGDREAMDYIVDHCRRDVEELESAFLRLKPIIRRIIRK